MTTHTIVEVYRVVEEEQKEQLIEEEPEFNQAFHVEKLEI